MRLKYFYALLLLVVTTCIILSTWNIPNRTSMVKYHCNQHEPTSGVLSIISDGHLGNMMMYYALLWCVSKKFSIPGAAVRPAMNKVMIRVFPGLTLPVTKVCEENFTKTSIEMFYQLSEEYVKEVKRTGGQIDYGPFRISSFQPYRRDILKEFKFSSDLSTGAQTILRSMKHNGTFVGVHVRRTDYVEHMPIIFGCTPVGDNYFRKAMGYMRQILPNPLFVVCGDDEEWAKTLVVEPNLKDTVWVGHRDNLELDMATLAACNNSIITMGSFGFWSAYLVGGMTIMADPDCEKPHPITEEARKANMPGWIFLDDE